MRRRNRRALGVEIRDAVLSLPEWRTETLDSGDDVLLATVGELEIMRTTAASARFGQPATNGIDIWIARKVFSMWWDDGEVDDDDFEIIAFAPGD